MSEFVAPTESDYELPDVDFTGIEEDVVFLKLLKNLKEYQSVLMRSPFWDEILLRLEPYSLKYINCYAIGSPQESKNALYQFAFLVELAKSLEVKVSLYDPILNKYDRFLAHYFDYEISFNSTIPEETLYFLPHAPLGLTEHLFVNHKPLYLLSNDLIVHTDRFTKLKLRETYDQVSLLVNLTNEVETENEFQVVKKRSRRKQFVPPEVVYDYSLAYFASINISRFKNNFNKGDDWGNSFSDLAFHLIGKKINSGHALANVRVGEDIDENTSTEKMPKLTKTAKTNDTIVDGEIANASANEETHNGENTTVSVNAKDEIANVKIANVKIAKVEIANETTSEEKTLKDEL